MLQVQKAEKVELTRFIVTGDFWLEPEITAEQNDLVEMLRETVNRQFELADCPTPEHVFVNRSSIKLYPSGSSLIHVNCEIKVFVQTGTRLIADLEI